MTNERETADPPDAETTEQTINRLMAGEIPGYLPPQRRDITLPSSFPPLIIGGRSR